MFYKKTKESQIDAGLVANNVVLPSLLFQVILLLSLWCLLD
ncbi:MAG: hypothetical protein WAO75_07280 [Atribacterales bacterium]